MPEVSRFYGIVVRIFYNDHPPPHVHVQYGEYKAVIRIEFPTLIAGRLPGRALGLVMEWTVLRQEELRRAWQQAEMMEPTDPIPPLD